MVFFTNLLEARLGRAHEARALAVVAAPEDVHVVDRDRARAAVETAHHHRALAREGRVHDHRAVRPPDPGDVDGELAGRRDVLDHRLGPGVLAEADLGDPPVGVPGGALLDP